MVYRIANLPGNLDKPGNTWNLTTKAKKIWTFENLENNISKVALQYFLVFLYYLTQFLTLNLTLT